MRLQTVRGELESMTMKETKRVAKYITQVEIMANSRIKETLPANRVVEKILRSLTDNFENLVRVIEESKDISTLTIEELVDPLRCMSSGRRRQ